MSRAAARLALLGLLAAPGYASADRRELYTTVELAPQVARFTDPVAEQARATAIAPGVSLAAFYGLTNSIHLGSAVHFATSRNVYYRSVHLVLRDGSPSDGALYVDAMSFGASVFANYRFDTGTRIAPVLQADVGFASWSYSNVEQIPSGTSIGLGFPSVSETVLELRASGRAEYRFGDHLVASAGAGLILAPRSLRPWAIYFPLAVGWIW